MGVSDQVLGLWDRKKTQTRGTIRREAMRLIEVNGYANTTVERIAEAAEVSPSTFFRYFPTKEMVMMANDLDQVIIEALEQQPTDMPSLQAFRRALEITMAMLSEDEWRFERARLCMVLSIPELKAAEFDKYRRTVARLTEADCRRTGREPNDFEVRVFVGAVAGGLMAVLDRASGLPDRMYQALDFMEAGMPLGATDGTTLAARLVRSNGASGSLVEGGQDTIDTPRGRREERDLAESTKPEGDRKEGRKESASDGAGVKLPHQ